jgi:hypothetical protein
MAVQIQSGIEAKLDSTPVIAAQKVISMETLKIIEKEHWENPYDLNVRRNLENARSHQPYAEQNVLEKYGQ